MLSCSSCDPICKVKCVLWNNFIAFVHRFFHFLFIVPTSLFTCFPLFLRIGFFFSFIPGLFFLFLGAPKHLYNWLYPSIGLLANLALFKITSVHVLFWTVCLPFHLLICLYVWYLFLSVLSVCLTFSLAHLRISFSYIYSCLPQDYYPDLKKRKFVIKELKLDFISVLSSFLQASLVFLSFCASYQRVLGHQNQVDAEK